MGSHAMEFAWPGYLPCLGCPQCLTSRFLEGRHFPNVLSISLLEMFVKWHPCLLENLRTVFTDGCISAFLPSFQGLVMGK